jgi:hypothetical protein
MPNLVRRRPARRPLLDPPDRRAHLARALPPPLRAHRPHPTRPPPPPQAMAGGDGLGATVAMMGERAGTAASSLRAAWQRPRALSRARPHLASAGRLKANGAASSPHSPTPRGQRVR